MHFRSIIYVAPRFPSLKRIATVLLVASYMLLISNKRWTISHVFAEERKENVEIRGYPISRIKYILIKQDICRRGHSEIK